MIGAYAGGLSTLGREAALEFWVGLRASFPSARFRIHHHRDGCRHAVAARGAALVADGTHDGWGSFGRPTGKRVHVMGMAHAEFGPWGLRREFALYDEIAIWRQILA